MFSPMPLCSVSPSFEMAVAASAHHLWRTGRDADHETKSPWTEHRDAGAGLLRHVYDRRPAPDGGGVKGGRALRATLRDASAPTRRIPRRHVRPISIARVSPLS